MDSPKSAAVDPLDDPNVHCDAYHGAVLLSDQIEYYVSKLDPPLLANPDGSRLNFADSGTGDCECLDTASYKLRLGEEAHIGGNYVKVSDDKPLVLAPHQVAVVKAYEIVNIPRFLVGRWNLRVKWVYEGLLWVGGPQVDPGWEGQLYCPIYNLAEREVVIPFKERVFTMDFTRTTPFHEEVTTYGYRTKAHRPARAKNLGDHDKNRIRSAPFEKLNELESLNEFKNFAFAMLAVGFAAVGAITAALAVVAIRPVAQFGEGAKLLSFWPLTAVTLSIIAFVLSIFLVAAHCWPICVRFFRFFRKDRMSA